MASNTTVINQKAIDYLVYLVGLPNLDQIINFLNPEISEKVDKEHFYKLIDFFSTGILPSSVSGEKNLDGTPIDSIVFDEKDAFSVWANGLGINYWLYSSRQSISLVSPQVLIDYEKQSGDKKTEKELRQFFYNTWLGQPTKPNFTLSTDYPAVNIAGEALYQRLLIWKKYKTSINSLTASQLSAIAKEELAFISEELGRSTDPNNVDPGNAVYLNELFDKIYPGAGEWNRNLIFGSILPDGSTAVAEWTKVYSIFNPNVINVTPALSPGNLNPKQFEAIFSKIKQSGLLTLATYAGEIAEFAKRRMASEDAVKKSAITYLNPMEDLGWLDQLGFVVANVSRDPILLSTINMYFPSIVTFFFDALAASADYSNEGRGGGGEDTINSYEDFKKSLQSAFGVRADAAGNFQDVFKLAADFNNTSKQIKEILDKSPYRESVSPKTPDIFHLRLGAANFYIPPLSINVNTAFKTGSLTGGALRQKNTPKFNSGFKETSITLRLFFPNYEEIWGISIEDASKIVLKDNFVIDFSASGDTDNKIDKFLSSLRGLVAAFKYSPFLPIRNSYLNSVHGITAVALSGMQIQTVPNFPFALAVDIELLNFNHKPLLPMISDFNQAIHWGKYRQYMGKAANSINSYVNGDFLLKTTDVKGVDNLPKKAKLKIPALGNNKFNETLDLSYDEDRLNTNVINEWTDGNNITFYIPVESQTKIFLPDTTSFRRDNEELINSQAGLDFFSQILGYFGIDVNKAADYGITLANTYDLSSSGQYNKNIKSILRDSMDILTTGVSGNDPQKKIYDYLVKVFMIENKSLSTAEKKYLQDINSTSTPGTSGTSTYRVNGEMFEGTLSAAKDYIKRISKSSTAYLDHTISTLADKRAKAEGVNLPVEGSEGTPRYQDIKNQAKKEVSDVFSVLAYERFFNSGPIQALMEAARAKSGAFQFREWEVPMMKVDLDPKYVTVKGVSVSFGNNLAKLQLQMQDEPTYQHIGGKDSFINISMIVKGEMELAKIKKIFDHVNSLARLEHAGGVLGFIGIKNIITALSGIKYVIPSNYSVSTIPDYPHAYEVNITLMDFDVFQQTREKMSSQLQQDFIDNFAAKRNPFLRIKQLWGSFNAYPDLPLDIKNSSNEIVGNLDPDFYFRSFEMFDKDVINNIKTQSEKIDIPTSSSKALAIQEEKIKSYLPDFLRNWDNINNEEVKKNKLNGIAAWINENNIDYILFMKIFSQYAQGNGTDVDYKVAQGVLTDYLEFTEDLTSGNIDITNVISAGFRVGDLKSSGQQVFDQLQSALSGEYSIPGESEVSFMPEDFPAHHQIHMMPIKDPNDPGKIHAMLTTAYGVNFGYVDLEKEGRFYLTIDGVKVDKDTRSMQLVPSSIDEHMSPAHGTTNPAIPSLTPLSGYGSPISHGDNGGPEFSSKHSSPPTSVNSHWEKMLVDTSYRDLSGRMIRAFPTYMLWLIDEGGFFAGVKLFDNFYGLQSIIDFSVVSSEDLLGDTFIFRVSNLYSKLNKAASTDIFGPDSQVASTFLGSQTASILDNTLNKARNILGNMKNEYTVNIENIVLKPGVRVHLRGGYGSNPNSLQTLFNGTITQVEYGEIITITAQSDAIELGAMANSTNKKGDSGKIDGGINTGLWLSEPRDLMVRLLSMGSSRFKEGIANANRGLVFSENKFGIRHFGSMLYQPMTPREEAQHYKRVDGIADAHKAANQLSGGTVAKYALQSVGVGQDFRYPVASLMGQLWANFSAQRDMEIFKRNIYPGNGTGIAQFLGGDLGDGWTSVASITPENQPNPRLDYLSRLSERSWNNLAIKLDSGVPGSSQTVEQLASGGTVRDPTGSATLTKNLSLGGIGVAMAIAGGPVTATIGVGVGLLGVLSGRGGNNIFRTLGLVSANSDDDMPGFDEVSFRAQTYMRTVWELFQTCARLLPNYIVAVRPFEDRSTVFYGKPHWLYTSGVIPITTGYPGDDKAEELGIIPPQINSPDFDLLNIITEMNKNITPYADAEAFLKSTEPIAGLSASTESQLLSTGIFNTSKQLKGKLINLNSKKAQIALDDKGTPVAKLPTLKGNVGVGFHLPVGSEQVSSSVNSKDRHWQIPQLPARFRFPFFASRVEDQLSLENYSFQYSNLSGGSGSAGEWKSDNKNFIGKKIEKVYGAEFSQLLSLDISFQSEKGISGVMVSELLGNPLDFGTNPIDGIFPDIITVKMPFPEVPSTGVVPDIFEFKNNSTWKPYSEWKFPENELDEQFHIAMRWPYNISTKDTSVISSFKKYYFDGDESELIGTAQDYKNQHILIYNPNGDSGRGSAVVCKPAYFMWGKNDTKEASRPTGNDFGPGYEERNLSAVVSPDAAYYLGILTTPNRGLDDKGNYSNDAAEGNPGYAITPDIQECHFAFVPNTIPLGVAYTSDQKITNNLAKDDSKDLIIGFGQFDIAPLVKTEDTTVVVIGPDGYTSTVVIPGKYQEDEDLVQPGIGTNIINEFTAPTADSGSQGGNYRDYYDQIAAGKGLPTGGKYPDITVEYGRGLLASEDGKMDYGNNARTHFASVYSATDSTSVDARRFYDEDFDPLVSVIAGNGRTLSQAQQIWDEFRFSYHTEQSVKDIFFATLSMDPDSEETFPPEIQKIFSPDAIPADYESFKKFGYTTKIEGTADHPTRGVGNAIDEFSLLFGDAVTPAQNKAVEYARANLIDAPIEQGGLINYFNALTIDKIRALKENLFQIQINFSPAKVANTYESEKNLAARARAIERSEAAAVAVENSKDKNLFESITNPKALFLYVVGLFRQSLWSDPYARAWLVLKPDRKIFVDAKVETIWSFKPVNPIFQAFIFPGNTYAKDKSQFIQLLYKNKGEGNSSTNLISKGLTSLGDFYQQSIGQVFNAVTDSLSALFQMFKLNMLQTGYGLSQSSILAREANILNKALNDSIFYSMGRPGSLLRAVDNPFTREYAEPVIEIREPFQRVHYLSSFSHILSNRIQENSGVATTITAVSDGKSPVTVALDKGAPADRQVEATVETGIYFDNVVGNGFFGFLHPLLHPLETGRGISKNLTGAPDELSAKRIALSHLKESVKDIYGGEIIVIGNPDIRPYDLVYLADVYERMYGMFEVEQVIHHFTPELGFVTSITPNALVTVNDPAKWFMTSWLHSWLNVQTIRNDTRIYLDSIRAGNSGITMGDEISLDALGNSLTPQMMGGMQFTGGSSALTKDIIANVTASGMTNTGLGNQIRMQAQVNGNNGQITGGNIAAVIAGTAGMAVATGGAVSAGISGAAAVAAGTVAGVGAAPIIAGAAIIAGPLVWKAWSWVRDKLLDQHGCYIQYLTRNGQPMEAGLSYNQGMVVGRYHSISLLPGILGVRTKTLSPDGYQYIRTNDLMKSMGWSEKDTDNFVRYVSYENALVHAQVLGLSGLGPDKTTFEPFFKVLCTLKKGGGFENSGVTDGDTIEVQDILNPDVSFTVRLDGINVSEKIQIGFTNTALKTGSIIGTNIRYIDNKYYATVVTGTMDTYADGTAIKYDSEGFALYKVAQNTLTPESKIDGVRLAGDKVNVRNVGDSFNVEGATVLSSSVIDPTYSQSVLNYFTYEISDAQGRALYELALEDKITLIPNKKVFPNIGKGTYFEQVVPGNDLVVEDFGSPGMMATQFVKTALENKTFVVRVKQSRVTGKLETEADFEPNTIDNTAAFLKDRYLRTLGVIFYNTTQGSLDGIMQKVFEFFRENKFASAEVAKKFVEFFDAKEDVFGIHYSKIYDKIASSIVDIIDPDLTYQPMINAISANPDKKEISRVFSILVELMRLRQLYITSSKWPLILWDEYYDDGTPTTLNWELIARNYGTTVYTRDLLTESESVIQSSQQTVSVKGGY